MDKGTEVRDGTPAGVEDVLTELLRTGARELIQQAVEAELAELLQAHAGRTDGEGRAAVVRNGYLPERAVLTGLGPVGVQVPKVRSLSACVHAQAGRTAAPVVFHSRLVPPYVRRRGAWTRRCPGCI